MKTWHQRYQKHQDRRREHFWYAVLALTLIIGLASKLR